MASGREQMDEYHQQFTNRIIRALKEGTAPWQKAWQPGERVLPRDFSSGHDYRGGNAVYLAMTALDRGYADPRWSGWRQIRESGGYVLKGEKGTPILYVDWRQSRTAGDEHGDPVLDGEGRPKLEWVQRDRPLVKLRHVFNVEQTEGLELPSLQVAASEWEGLERAEALMRNSGIRVDHVKDDRAYYNFFENRVVLPERSQFPSQSAYTRTALHELGHATGHSSRVHRPTFVNRGGFGSETYAREELRAEIAAMMTGERLGVGHEPRHGTAYVSSWIKALENEPKEMRAAAVDAQRISDWLIARDRERTVADDKAEHARTGDAAAPAAGERAMAHPASVGTATRGAPAMSEELRTVLRDTGAAGYRAGYEAAADRMPVDPFQSARVFFPPGTGKDAAFVLEQAHGSAYLRGMHDQQRGLDPAPEGCGACVRPSGGNPARGARADGGSAEGRRRGIRPRLRRRRGRAGEPRSIEPGTRDGPWTGGCGAPVFSTTRRPKATCGDTTTGSAGPVVPTPLSGGIRWKYVKEVTAVDDRAKAELRYVPRRAPARDPKRSPRVVRAARTGSPVEHDAPLRGPRTVVAGAQPGGGGETAGGTLGRGR